jgi:hypothetical protein
MASIASGRFRCTDCVVSEQSQNGNAGRLCQGVGTLEGLKVKVSHNRPVLTRDSVALIVCDRVILFDHVGYTESIASHLAFTDLIVPLNL